MSASPWPSVRTVTLTNADTGATVCVDAVPTPIEEIPAGAEMVDRRNDCVVTAAGQLRGNWVVDFECGDLGIAEAGEIFDVLPTDWWRGLFDGGGA